MNSTSLSKRPGVTPGGMFGLAMTSILLLCGAGLTPIGNVQKSDINANGFSITNAATVSAANFVGNGAGLTNVVGPAVYLDGNLNIDRSPPTFQGQAVKVSSSTFSGQIPFALTGASSIDTSGITGLLGTNGSYAAGVDAEIALTGTNIASWNIANVVVLQGGASSSDGSDYNGYNAIIHLTGQTTDPGVEVQHIWGGNSGSDGGVTGGSGEIDIYGTLTSVNLSSLQSLVAGSDGSGAGGGCGIFFTSDPDLVALNLSGLTLIQSNAESYSAQVVNYSSSLTTITVNSSLFMDGSRGGQPFFSFNGCGLTVSTVNAVLVAADAGGSTNAYIDLSGGTSATPTGAGVTAASDLAANGCTVLTN